MARSAEEKQRRRRRRRLAKALVVGAAAVGLPALANTLVDRRARRLPKPRWGTPERYRWRYGEVPYQSLGGGEPLVLIHSFGPGHGGFEWLHSAKALARHRRVLVPDLLGWGEADHPAVEYRAPLYVRLLGDFLADVAGESAVLVAAGMTASYALQVAVDRPDAVRALGLVVPLGVELRGAEPDLRDTVVHRLLRLPILGSSALNLVTSRRALERYLRREVFYDPALVTPDLVDCHYRSSHVAGAHRTLAAYVTGRLNHPVEELLERVGQPVWIAWGREASSPAVEAADLWLRGLANAELEVFSAAALHPHAEAARLFCPALDRFLGQLPEDAGATPPATES